MAVIADRPAPGVATVTFSSESPACPPSTTGAAIHPGTLTAAAGPGARLVPASGSERFDILPLLVATDGAAAAFGHDLRRLRPNLVIGGVEGLAEREWEWSLLAAGEAVVALADLRGRCIMTTYDPDTLEQDVGVLRHIHAAFDGRLALNAWTAREGRVQLKDSYVEFRDGEAFLPVMGIGSLQVAGRTVVELKRDLVARFAAIYKETHVELLITRYAGHGRLEGPGRVVVEPSKKGSARVEIEAKRILLATGSKPAGLRGVTVDGDRIGTSTEALSYPAAPEHLVVIGAGYIGLELGSVWRRLGSKVTVLEYLDDYRKTLVMKCDGLTLGWGMAGCAWVAGRFPAEASVELRDDGTARVACGTQDIGTGTYTIISQIVADAMGVPLDAIQAHIGDTALPVAGVSAASATIVYVPSGGGVAPLSTPPS